MGAGHSGHVLLNHLLRELPADRVSISTALQDGYFAPERLEVLAGDGAQGFLASRGRYTILRGEVAAEIANLWKDEATRRAETGLKLDTFLGGGTAEGCEREGPRNGETQWVVQGRAADSIATTSLCGMKLRASGPLGSQVQWLKAFRRVNAPALGDLYASYARRLRRLGEEELGDNGKHLLNAEPRSVFLTATQTQAQKYTGVDARALEKPLHYDGSASHLAMALQRADAPTKPDPDPKMHTIWPQRP